MRDADDIDDTRSSEAVEFYDNRSRGRGKTRKSAQTRERIIRTASELLMERGSSAFQMGEISERCGMSKGALYYYFSDKEDLLKAIFRSEIDALVQAIDEDVAEAATGNEALQKVIRTYATRVRSGGPLAMALVHELVLSRVDAASGKQWGILHIIDLVAEQLERSKAEGIIRPDVNVRLTATAVCGAYVFSGMMAPDGFADELYQMVHLGIGEEPLDQDQPSKNADASIG